MRSANWLVLGAATALVMAAVVLVPPGWIEAADARLAPWRPWLGGVRAAAIAAVWIWWNRLVGRIPGLAASAADHLRSRRHFWCGALAAVELVLVRNVPGALWRLAA